eukprot:4646775-Amphidinium_carterae.1
MEISPPPSVFRADWVSLIPQCWPVATAKEKRKKHDRKTWQGSEAQHSQLNRRKNAENWNRICGHMANRSREHPPHHKVRAQRPKDNAAELRQVHMTNIALRKRNGLLRPQCRAPHGEVRAGETSTPATWKRGPG